MKELAKKLIDVWYDNGSVVVEQDGRLTKMESMDHINASNFTAAIFAYAYDGAKVYTEANK